jgi:hypothetical protein
MYMRATDARRNDGIAEVRSSSEQHADAQRLLLEVTTKVPEKVLRAYGRMGRRHPDFARREHSLTTRLEPVPNAAAARSLPPDHSRVPHPVRDGREDTPQAPKSGDR